jgi:hypothetical protein
VHKLTYPVVAVVDKWPFGNRREQKRPARGSQLWRRHHLATIAPTGYPQGYSGIKVFNLIIYSYLWITRGFYPQCAKPLHHDYYLESFTKRIREDTVRGFIGTHSCERQTS